MKNAVILHGKPDKDGYYDPSQPSSSNFLWIPWLQKQLIVHDIKADTPEAPYAYAPDYQLWLKEVERFEIGPETLLVGHSAGSGFWLRYLSEHPGLRVGKVILVAPSLGSGWNQNQAFMTFELDTNLVARTAGVVIFAGDNDKQSTLNDINRLQAELNGVQVRWFKGYGHFIDESLRSGFPELAEECFKDGLVQGPHDVV